MYDIAPRMQVQTLSVREISATGIYWSGWDTWHFRNGWRDEWKKIYQKSPPIIAYIQLSAKKKKKKKESIKSPKCSINTIIYFIICVDIFLLGFKETRSCSKMGFIFITKIKDIKYFICVDKYFHSSCLKIKILILIWTQSI